MGESALRGYLILIGVLLIANNLLPYLGLRDDSCQTMFSSLEWAESENNHLFMPQYAVSDGWAYRVDVHVTVEPPPELDLLLRWLRQPGTFPILALVCPRFAGVFVVGLMLFHFPHVVVMNVADYPMIASTFLPALSAKSTG